MPDRPYPLSGHPLSKAELRKKLGIGNDIYEFLEWYALRDMAPLFDEFNDIALDTTNKWAVANGGGAAIVSFAINVQQGGFIRATTGTGNGDTSTCSLIGAKNWFGSANAMIRLGWKPITAVTETRIELGFVDVVPGSTKSVVNSLTTPTVNTSVVDAALLVYNHTGSTTTNELVTIGSAIAAAKTTFTPVTARAATVYSTLRILINSTTVLLWNDGQLVASHNAAGTDYIASADGVAPFALIRASNATSKSLDIDYIHCIQDRVG